MEKTRFAKLVYIFQLSLSLSKKKNYDREQRKKRKFCEGNIR